MWVVTEYNISRDHIECGTPRSVPEIIFTAIAYNNLQRFVFPKYIAHRSSLFYATLYHFPMVFSMILRVNRVNMDSVRTDIVAKLTPRIEATFSLVLPVPSGESPQGLPAIILSLASSCQKLSFRAFSFGATKIGDG